MKRIIKLGDCRFEVISEKGRFVGIGGASIGKTAVRSGRLPLRPYTQSYQGHELAELRLAGIKQTAAEARIRLEAIFRPLPVKLMRDHSFDPIHELGDWDGESASVRATAAAAGRRPPGSLDIVLRPAADSFDGTDFTGFSYHYEYKSRTVPL
ncbi:MAG TPA: hypothetical protein VM223_15175, partial [Planctomycetota bacterium]|nr:hypothetical protein [Planctomycetota bacterium]